MKALLLAAGLGTRLRPLTDTMPKAMVPINGKPCIQHCIENLKKQGVTDFVINTHYLPEAITSYFGDGSKFGVKIKYSHEPEILGTSGALNNLRNVFTEPFLVVYSDVLADFDLQSLINEHQKNSCIVTIALDNCRSMIGKGAVLTKGRKVISFIEKPVKEIEGAKINSGIYLLNPSVLDIIPKGFSDFGRDILPKLAKEEKLGWIIHRGYLFDIGTLEDLKKAEEFITS